MGKILRAKVTVEAMYYNFDKRYEEAMSEFEEVRVISIALVSSIEAGDTQKEVYIVFYQEIEEEMEE